MESYCQECVINMPRCCQLS